MANNRLRSRGRGFSKSVPSRRNRFERRARIEPLEQRQLLFAGSFSLSDLGPAESIYPVIADQGNWSSNDATFQQIVSYDLASGKQQTTTSSVTTTTVGVLNAAGRDPLIDLAQLYRDPDHASGSVNLPMDSSPSGAIDSAPGLIFGADGRTLVSPTTSFPWTTIGRLWTVFPDGTQIACSGALIDAYHVITSGSAVYQASHGGWLSNGTVSLGQAGNVIDFRRSDNEPFGEANITYARSYAGWTTNGDYDYDIALVTLDRNAGNLLGWLGYGANPDNNYYINATVYTAGYPADLNDQDHNGSLDHQNMYFESGPITSDTTNQLQSNQLDVAAGQAGSPIYLYFSDTGNRAVHAVVSHETSSGGTPLYNAFTRITTTRFSDIGNWRTEDNSQRPATDLPDLTDYDAWFRTNVASFTPGAVSPGQSFTARAVVRNNGTAPAGSFTVSFYASTNTIITTADYLIGSTTISNLNPFYWSDAVFSGTFPSIPSGNYFVGWTIDSGGTQAEFDESNNTGVITGSLLTVAAGAGSIAGTVFEDVNGNGTQDSGELGLAGWTVYLDQNRNGRFDTGEPSTASTSAGSYAFNNLSPGTYTVAQILQSGWRQTSPAFSASYSANEAAQLDATREYTVPSLSPGRRLTKESALDLALSYLQAAPELFGLPTSFGRDPATLGSIMVTDLYQTDITGTTQVYLAQQVNRRRVLGTEMTLGVAADGTILSAAGSLCAPSSMVAAATSQQAVLTAEQAVQSAADHLGLGAANPRVIQASLAANRKSALTQSGISLDTIPAELVYVRRADNSLVLAWDLVIRTTDKEHWYNVQINAENGAIEGNHDWVDHAAYDVFDRPNESPLEGGRSIVTNPADPTASPFGWHDTNGAAGAEFTDTRGNNVFAQEDVDANDLGGFRPSGGTGLNFDFSFDPNATPAANQSAAITNLFYWNNLLHDIHYHYGFTEAAGNFQLNTYGKGGIGQDEVMADAQDGSGLNNAIFSTPPDGTPGRMQMYIFNHTNPNRDGDFDNGVIIHEYGHGVSNRLTGGPANANALDAQQSAGMGEGWSDWWALMLTQRSTDQQMSAYPLGAYVFGSAGGIRTVPYSYDMSIDNWTFGKYNTIPAGIGFAHEVHTVGEIWTTVLWDLNWVLINKYGFNPNVATGYTGTGTAGNILALQLIMDALKLQPANPSFLQARDAILAADRALTGGANQSEIWSTFARRGMGYSAVDASADATTVTEAFDTPPVSLPGTYTVVLAAGQNTTGKNFGNQRIALPSISIANAQTLEGNSGTTNLAFTVTLSSASASTVTVSYATANGTATAGSDYTATSGVVTFNPGVTSATILVPILGDTLVEPDETFLVNLSNPVNATLGNAQATGTILNDDVTLPSISIANAQTLEGNSGTTNLAFTVTLSTASTANVSVNFATANGTATAGSDYTATSGTMFFGPGATSATILVPILGDTLVEPDETFLVNLSNPVNATLGNAQATGTILNDDVTFPSISIANAQTLEGNSGTTNLAFTVTLSNASASTVTVGYTTANGTATAGSDYTATSGVVTFNPGATSATILVPILGDTLVEPDETFLVNLSNPVNATLGNAQATGTILNDDGTTTTEFIIDDGDAGFSTVGTWGTGQPSGSYLGDQRYSAIGSGGDKATYLFTGLAPGQYSISSHWAAGANHATNTPFAISDNNTLLQTVPVNQQLTPNDEQSHGVGWKVLGTFTINSGTLKVVVSDNADIGYVFADAVRIVGSSGGSVPSISIANAQTLEGNSGTTNLAFTVTLSSASASTVTVGYATANGTATAGSDYTATSGVVTFNPGVTSATILVPILGDTLVEPDETFLVNLSNPVNATLGNAQATGTILNDDGTTTTEFIIDDGDAGFTTVGNWQRVTPGAAYLSDQRTNSAGTGSDAATYTFTGLAPGQYKVTAHWAQGRTRATNTPFTVYDNGTALGTVRTSQRVAPSGETSHGVNWTVLGTFAINSGTLKVVISDNANGTVLADAIRIVRLGSASAAPRLALATLQSQGTSSLEPLASQPPDAAMLQAALAEVFDLAATGSSRRIAKRAPNGAAVDLVFNGGRF
jgi:uncharacterized protein (DUF2141 family)